ncbi:PepSY domain-containing protein [Paraclostridium bifermentans]|nr:PepSY domain-containing protein [Paraclostridium bifermentans]
MELKDLDDDNMSVVYEFKIKDKNNMLNEIELDSKTGAIIDMENHNEKDDKDYDSDDEKSYNYNEIKSKSKYSEEELKNIALKKVQGEVIGVDKEIDDDSMSIVYEFKIKDKNNIIKEVEVDSVSGKVVDIENYDSSSDKNNETIDNENVKQGTSNMD